MFKSRAPEDDVGLPPDEDQQHSEPDFFREKEGDEDEEPPLIDVDISRQVKAAAKAAKVAKAAKAAKVAKAAREARATKRTLDNSSSAGTDDDDQQLDNSSSTGTDDDDQQNFVELLVS